MRNYSECAHYFLDYYNFSCSLLKTKSAAPSPNDYFWNLSICSLGERGERSGVQELKAAWKGAACPRSARPSPCACAQLGPASGVEIRANSDAQDFFSEMWQYVLWGIVKILWPWFFCLSFRKCWVKKKKVIEKTPRESQREFEIVTRVQRWQNYRSRVIHSFKANAYSKMKLLGEKKKRKKNLPKL